MSTLLKLTSLAGLVLSAVGAFSLLRGGTAPAEAAAAHAGSPASVSSAEVSSIATSSAAAAPPFPSAEPSPVGDPATSPWTACSNLTLGYELRYPNDWYTAWPNHQLECRYFDDRPFVVGAKDTTLPKAAIRVYPAAHTYTNLDRVLDGETNTDVISRLNTTVDGHRAFVVELMTHSAAYGDTPIYVYVIDLGHDALALDTPELFAKDYPAAKSRLDLLITTFRFLPGGVG